MIEPGAKKMFADWLVAEMLVDRLVGFGMNRKERRGAAGGEPIHAVHPGHVLEVVAEVIEERLDETARRCCPRFANGGRWLLVRRLLVARLLG